MRSEQPRPDDCPAPALGLARERLDAAEVLGAHVAVLSRAEQADRRAVVAVQRVAVEPVGEQHALGEGVLDQEDRPEPVEAAERYVGDLDARVQRRFDDRPIEGRERHPFPAQVGRRPAGHTVEVGRELPPGQRGELGQRHVEGLRYCAADGDDRVGGDGRRRAPQVGPEPREALDALLPGRQLASGPGPGDGFVHGHGAAPRILTDRRSVTDQWSVL